MKPFTKTRRSLWCAILCFLAARMPQAFANPTGMTVGAGSASAQQTGSQLNITVGQTTILNWQSFNIAGGETTTFLQPGANSVVLNVIGGANPSQIFGNLNANGTVILANGNGFYFGPNSMIKVGGSFVATTAPIINDFGSGAGWQFMGMPPLASIVNYGQIEVGAGKSLFLIAENIENHGSLSAPGGNVDLAAGESVLVSDSPDGRGLSAAVTLPQGSVDNFGRVTADGGSIMMQAKVVNQDGLLEANSVQNRNGVIELVAADQLNLGANSQISAQGDDSAAGSAGGTVAIKSGNSFSDAEGSQIATTGGANGGDGGNIEISAPVLQSLNSAMNARAKSGFSGGKFLLDPANIILSNSTAGGAININTVFAGFSSILLQASGNITLNSSTTWNLSGSTGNPSGQLTLEAGGDITFANNARITDANGWAVTLEAGYNFNTPGINSGTGNIFLNGGNGKTFNGTIQLASGAVNLLAGQGIYVGSGSVYTTGGGSIYAEALAGDINCGTANGSYQFSIFGYSVASVLGGISTAAGGDVTLVAGNNITSIPTIPAGQPAGASGAYGPEAGNVTVVAGGQVSGNYTLANGVGTMLAGVEVNNGAPAVLNSASDVGSAQRPVNLSLIAGSWNVWAADNIYIGEVRNPNGTFNANQLAVPNGEYVGNIGDATAPGRSSFLFDYAADAAVNLWAGNAIELVGANLPRVNGQNQSMPPIYAPILTLNAGAGGVTIDNTVILYPSSEGALHVTTRNGGGLNGVAQGTSLSGIIMSDSGLPGWATFAQGTAVRPLHLNNPNPVTLDISGDINTFSLIVPTFADIQVGGSTYNFGFLGRNLSPAQTTTIAVAGNIAYRGDLTSEVVKDALPKVLFTASADPTVTGKLRYNAQSGQLTFIGVMSATDLAFLLNPLVYVLDSAGKPVLDASGNPLTTALTLTSAQQTAFQKLYADSQSATLGDQGLALSGAGKFNISANRIDLGISGGITVTPPDSALGQISQAGAQLNITTVGDLEMSATKIANEGLFGGINLTVGGRLDIRGEFTTFGDPNPPKGVFSTGGGDVSVLVKGDVNVNGSRIAAYDGGNVTVESINGNVNAGVGGAGYVSMTALELDPVTGNLVTIPASIPGSGILATTVPGSQSQLGNILVETPRGNITASQGGVIQISFNGTDSSKATAELLAGYELQDGSGNRVSAANLDSGTAVTVSEARNVDASGSGVIAQNIIAKATGEVKGLLIGRGHVDVDANQIGPIIIFTPGPVSLTSKTAGPTPEVLSEEPHTDNGVATATEGPASNVAKNETPSADTAATAATKTEGSDEEDPLGTSRKGRGKGIALAQKASRVTVLLPEKK